MSVTVQLPGYRPATIGGLADILGVVNGMRTGAAQREQLATATEGQKLTNQQAQASANVQKQLGDFTSPLSQQVVGGVGAAATMAKNRADKLGMDSSMFDPIINSAKNGVPAKDDQGNMTTRPMTGIEATSALKEYGPLFESVKSAEDNASKMVEAKAKELEARAHAYDAGMPGYGPAPIKPVAGEPIDPATLVRGRVSKAQQESAFKEIKNNQDIINVAEPSLAAFDQAAKEVGGANGLFSRAAVGLATPGQKAFTGLANTTVKDVEGTARQAAFDSIEHNFRPAIGDTPDFIKSKRDAWVEYLKSHASAPISKSAGIDLTKYPSTSLPPSVIGSLGGGSKVAASSKGPAANADLSKMNHKQLQEYIDTHGPKDTAKAGAGR